MNFFGNKNTHTLRLPFDWKNPIGYSVAVAIEFHLAAAMVHYVECFLVFGFAALLYIFSVVKDIQNDLNQFNETAKLKKLQSDCLEQLNGFIRAHAKIKELSSKNLSFFQ